MEKIIEKYQHDGFLHLDENQKVPVDTFRTLFKDCNTYNDMLLVDKGYLGYKPFVEKWRSEGLI